MIKLVVFDLDNTLYDYDYCNKSAEKALFNELSDLFSVDLEYCKKLLCEAKLKVKNQLGNVAASHNRLLYTQNICERLGVNPLLYAMQLYDTYWNAFLNSMTGYNYVIPLFDRLKSAGIEIGILTDLTAAIQFRKLSKLEVAGFVDYFVTSEEAGEEKPSRKMFDLMVKKSGYRCSEIIMVGDDKKKDIDGAEALGIRSILFDTSIDVWKKVSEINEADCGCTML